MASYISLLLLGGFVLKIVLNIISILSFSLLITDVTEEQIGENITYLKKQHWFQNYLSSEKYRKLIIHDKDVRTVIGTFNNKKLNRHSYQRKCQKKLDKVFEKNVEKIA